MQPKNDLFFRPFLLQRKTMPSVEVPPGPQPQESQQTELPTIVMHASTSTLARPAGSSALVRDQERRRGSLFAVDGFGREFYFKGFFIALPDFSGRSNPKNVRTNDGFKCKSFGWTHFFLFSHQSEDARQLSVGESDRRLERPR
jgi:hypothetical protein